MPPIQSDYLPKPMGLGDMRAAVDNALPPRHPGESADSFERRGNAALARPIICAMHRCFVTSATATRATKEYEAIWYDPMQGVEFLVSELLHIANKMRESPSQFSIRQRFMRLLPVSEAG
jgi:hypothetical protein